MQPTVINAVSAESVSYEEALLAELEVDGVAYRVDPGRVSSVAASWRESGSWDWTAVTRWDGSRLRAKGLDHKLVMALADALGAAMRERGKDGAA